MPYSILQRAFLYLNHCASSFRLHGVHSPFVYDIQKCINRSFRRLPEDFANLFDQELMGLHFISGEDYGSDGSVVRKSVRQLKGMLLHKVELSLLMSLAAYHRPDQILELGTCLGRTASALALQNPESHVLTIEGNRGLSDFSQRIWTKAGIKNVLSLNTTFEDFFQNNTAYFDMVFIDGDHRYEPTMRNFIKSVDCLRGQGPVVLHDIYWSGEMRQAWAEIQRLPRVTVCLDFFFFGVVYLRPEQARQTFKLHTPLWVATKK